MAFPQFQTKLMYNSLEKTEDGISITCLKCNQTVLLNPNKYNERYVRLIYLKHMRSCTNKDK